MEIIKYTEQYREEWDAIVKESKNNSFLFQRDFMEYHSDRFIDNSLIIKEKGRILALFPANRRGNTLISHEGLTYGGIIMTKDNKAKEVVDILMGIKEYCKFAEMNRIVYKEMPTIYHTIPSEEDRYALYINNAKLVKCDISSTICNKYSLGLNKGKKSNVRKAIKNNVIIEFSEEYDAFIKLVNDNLVEKYQKNAVHTSEEIKFLKSRFSGEINLIVAKYKDRIVAGVLIFEMKTVAHLQYITSNSTGREVRALDLVIEQLINNHYSHKDYIDFGISTEENKLLNEGLINQKESFGGRGTCYNTYIIEL